MFDLLKYCVDVCGPFQLQNEEHDNSTIEFLTINLFAHYFISHILI